MHSSSRMLPELSDSSSSDDSRTISSRYENSLGGCSDWVWSEERRSLISFGASIISELHISSFLTILFMPLLPRLIFMLNDFDRVILRFLSFDELFRDLKLCGDSSF